MRNCGSQQHLRAPAAKPWLLLIIAFLAMHTPAGTDPQSVSNADRFGSIDRFLQTGARARVIAHRGFSGSAPENTLAAFRRAVEVGADMLELDVQLTRDGQVVVLHDETVDRTTDGVGRVSALEMVELQRLDAGSWFAPGFAREPIPRLAEVLELARDRILVNVEIKSEALGPSPAAGIAEKVALLIRRAGLQEQVLVSSFNPTALERLRSVDPEIRTASLFHRQRHRGMTPLEVVQQVGSRAFFVNQKYLSEEMVQRCHTDGIAIGVYTVNDIPMMQNMLTLGVDAIFTDHPDRLLTLLK